MNLTEDQFRRLLELAYVAQGIRKDDRELIRRYDRSGFNGQLLHRTKLATQAILREVEDEGRRLLDQETPSGAA
jgi:hypothetical protein